MAPVVEVEGVDGVPVPIERRDFLATGDPPQ